MEEKEGLGVIVVIGAGHKLWSSLSSTISSQVVVKTMEKFEIALAEDMKREDEKFPFLIWG